MLVLYIILLGLLFAALVFTIYIGYMSYCSGVFKEIFNRKRPVPKTDRSPLKIDQKTVFGKGKNWFYTTRREYLNVRITSFDGTALAGYFRPSHDRSARDAVILLHGLDEHPSESAAYARLMMRNLQCHVLITHLRAHQMSGGKYCTYGIYESVDLGKWMEFIKRQVGPKARIFIVGRGIGATAALLAAAQRDFPKDAAGIIADSPLVDLESYVRRNLEDRRALFPSMIMRSLDDMFRSKLNTNFSFGNVRAVSSSIKVPVLVLSGSEDTITTPESIRDAYDALRCRKRLLTVDYASHLMAYDKAPASVEREVRAFVEQCVERLVSIGIL